MLCFVSLGIESDYDLIACKALSKIVPYFFYKARPEMEMKGIKKFFYKLHNSEKINRYIHLPFRKMWARYIMDEKMMKEIKNVYSDYIFVFRATGYRYKKMGVFDYLKKEFPSCKIVYRFSDKVEMYMNDNYYYDFKLEDLIDTFDCISTYNKMDSEKYNFLYTRPCLINYALNEKSDIDYDIFFVGKNKGRVNQIIKFFEICQNKNIKCDFYITDVPKEDQKYSNIIHYNEYISYEDVIKKIGNSKAILNIMQSGSCGFTRRDYEAIGMNKILITNNNMIKESIFYTEEKIIMLDNFENESEKIINFNNEKMWYGTKDFSALEWYNQYAKDIYNYRRSK